MCAHGEVLIIYGTNRAEFIPALHERIGIENLPENKRPKQMRI